MLAMVGVAELPGMFAEPNEVLPKPFESTDNLCFPK